MAYAMMLYNYDIELKQNHFNGMLQLDLKGYNLADVMRRFVKGKRRGCYLKLGNQRFWVKNLRNTGGNEVRLGINIYGQDVELISYDDVPRLFIRISSFISTLFVII